MKRTYTSLQPRNTDFNLAKAISFDVLIFSLIRKESQDIFWSRKKTVAKLGSDVSQRELVCITPHVSSYNFTVEIHAGRRGDIFL